MMFCTSMTPEWVVLISGPLWKIVYMLLVERLKQKSRFSECISLLQTLWNPISMLDRMGLMPCWRNLNHFDNVINVSFSDGRKFEDIFKVCVFLSKPRFTHISVSFQVILYATYNVLYEDQNHHLLLCCVQSKAVLRMWAGLKVHTDKTIAAGRRELSTFSLLMAVRLMAKFQHVVFPSNLNYY